MALFGVPLSLAAVKVKKNTFTTFTAVYLKVKVKGFLQYTV